jgi:hypothetical protein
MYQAQVTAVGAGRAASYNSNAFEFTSSSSCAFGVSPTSVMIGPTGSQGTLGISTGTTCNWSVSGAPSWVTFAVNAGTGSQNLTYTVAATTSTSARTATFSVANTQVTVSQSGINCSFNTVPGTTSFGSNGGSSSASVTTTSGCGWSASSPVSWITTSGTNFTGSGSAGYTVAANASTAARTATISVANSSLTITQAGAGPSCTFNLSASTGLFDWRGGTQTVALTTGSSCQWTATDNASWLTVTPTSGTGSATISFTAAKNWGSPRTAAINVNGQVLTVTQQLK